MTPRHAQNLRHAAAASAMVESHPDLQWLRGKTTLLAELGRVPDEGDRLDVARELCASRPNVKRAIGQVRRRRLGMRRGTPSALARAVRAAVSTYLAAHPMSKADAIAGIQLVIDQTSGAKPLRVKEIES